MKTLKQLRADPRIESIDLQDTTECEHKYSVALKEGYCWSWDGRLDFCDTVAEINEIMSEIIEDTNHEWC